MSSQGSRRSPPRHHRNSHRRDRRSSQSPSLNRSPLRHVRSSFRRSRSPHRRSRRLRRRSRSRCFHHCSRSPLRRSRSSHLCNPRRQEEPPRRHPPDAELGNKLRNLFRLNSDPRYEQQYVKDAFTLVRKILWSQHGKDVASAVNCPSDESVAVERLSELQLTVVIASTPGTLVDESGKPSLGLSDFENQTINLSSLLFTSQMRSSREHKNRTLQLTVTLLREIEGHMKFRAHRGAEEYPPEAYGYESGDWAKKQTFPGIINPRAEDDFTDLQIENPDGNTQLLSPKEVDNLLTPASYLHGCERLNPAPIIPSASVGRDFLPAAELKVEVKGRMFAAKIRVINTTSNTLNWPSPKNEHHDLVLRVSNPITNEEIRKPRGSIKSRRFRDYSTWEASVSLSPGQQHSWLFDVLMDGKDFPQLQPGKYLIAYRMWHLRDTIAPTPTTPSIEMIVEESVG